MKPTERRLAAYLDSPRPSHPVASRGVLPWPKAEASGLWPGLLALTHRYGMSLGPWRFLHAVRRARLRRLTEHLKKINHNSLMPLNLQSVFKCPRLSGEPMKPLVCPNQGPDKVPPVSLSIYRFTLLSLEFICEKSWYTRSGECSPVWFSDCFLMVLLTLWLFLCPYIFWTWELTEGLDPIQI